MKNTRKFISVLLAVVMVLSVMSIAAVSGSAYSSYVAHYSEDGLWLYRVGTSGTASLDCYLGTDGDIVVPATVDGYKVSGIWNGTFDGEDGSGRQTPVRVTISEGITTIETGTFRSCANLKEVILPDSITYIGSDAFLYSGIYKDGSNWEDGLLYIGKYLVASDSKISGNVTVKDGTRMIAAEAFFSRRNITSVSLPDSLEYICGSAFNWCSNLSKINFPESLTSIGEQAFQECSALNEISLPEGLEEVGTFSSAFSGSGYYNNEENWEDGVLYIGNYLIDANEEAGPVVEVKDGTTVIGASAFIYDAQNVEKIILPDSVLYINHSAFSDCPKLKSIKMSNNVKKIGSAAFSDDPMLKSVVIPDSIESFGTKVFQNCPKLESVVLGSGITYLSDDEFYNCPSLKSVTLPDTLLVIGDVAFNGCPNLKSIVLPDSLTAIGESAFCAYVPETGYGNVWGRSLKVIYGHRDTFAEQFANDNNIRFIEIGTFPDVPEDAWFFEAAKYNFEHGFITGYSNYNFGPADKLQRQDFIVILSRIENAELDNYTECPLGDIDMSGYYGNAVAWAVSEGIINGYQNGKFGVGDSITREQVATILYRYMGSPAVTGADETLAPFEDAGKISDFAKDAIVWAIQNNIISGKNATTLAPTATASRAEIATIIMRMDKAGMFDD